MRLSLALPFPRQAQADQDIPHVKMASAATGRGRMAGRGGHDKKGDTRVENVGSRSSSSQ